jgi:hypothetical protein
VRLRGCCEAPGGLEPAAAPAVFRSPSNHRRPALARPWDSSPAVTRGRRSPRRTPNRRRSPTAEPVNSVKSVPSRSRVDTRTPPRHTNARGTLVPGSPRKSSPSISCTTSGSAGAGSSVTTAVERYLYPAILKNSGRSSSAGSRRPERRRRRRRHHHCFYRGLDSDHRYAPIRFGRRGRLSVTAAGVCPTVYFGGFDCRDHRREQGHRHHRKRRSRWRCAAVTASAALRRLGRHTNHRWATQIRKGLRH